MTGYEITKEQLKAYKGTSIREYRQNKSQRAFERVYGKLKRKITLWSPLLSIAIIGLTSQMYV